MLELSTIEFRANMEKIISRFRVESMKEILRSKNLLEEAMHDQILLEQTKHKNEANFLKQKVNTPIFFVKIIYTIFDFRVWFFDTKCLIS